MPYNTAQGGAVPGLSVFTVPAGISTPYGVLLPPGSQIAAYVRNDGANGTAFKPFSADESFLNKLGVGTLEQGLARVRSGAGDTIVVLPGHSQNVVDNAMLTNLVAGTNIVGVGRGSLTPTFRWTAAASSWLVNKADVTISGLRLRMEGFNGVTLGMNISGADVSLIGNDIETCSGAANLCTNPISVTTGATRCLITGNVMRGTTGSATDGILLGAAVDGVRIFNNDLCFPVAVSVTHGNITISGANTNLRIGYNIIQNNVASTCALFLADVAASGAVYNNYTGVLTNGAAAAIGIIIAASTTHVVRFFENKSSDEAGKSGALNPAVAA